MTKAKKTELSETPIPTPLPFQTAANRKRVQFNTGSESKVVQSDALTADLSVIVKRYLEQGIPFPGQRGEPLYGDFSNVTDFHTARTLIAEAEANFMELPSDTRKLFQNDTGRLVDCMSNLDDPDNLALATEAGLLPPSEESTSSPSKAAVAPETAPTGTHPTSVETPTDAPPTDGPEPPEASRSN